MLPKQTEKLVELMEDYETRAEVLELLWKQFSKTQGASFLVVDEAAVAQFREWLTEGTAGGLA